MPYRNNIKCQKFMGFILFFMSLFGFGNVMAETISQDLIITSPQDGSIVAPGQTININVTVAPGVTYSGGVGIVVENIGFGPYAVKKDPPYSFSLTIPTSLIGQKKITAFGMTGPGDGVFSSPVSIDIESLNNVISFTANPTAINFKFVGEQIPFSVTGNFSNGSSAEITDSSNIIFESQNTNIAMVDKTGMVTAVSSGSTAIIISYDNVSIGLPISIPSTTRGDLNDDGNVDIDDINILRTALNTNANSSNDARDLNQDGKINALDARVMFTLCTYNRCATQP